MAIGIAIIMAGIALTTMSTSVAFATTDPNTVGEVTKRANEEYRSGDQQFDTLPGASETGRHAADPTGNGPAGEECPPVALGGGDTGRCGLALNRPSVDPTHSGSPQGTIEFVCGLDPDAAGCSALD
jgi:hypothetical protein